MIESKLDSKESLHQANTSTWQEVKIKEIAKAITSGGTPHTRQANYYNGDIAWLNTKEVKNARIYTTEKTITELGLKNSSAKWIDKDSVIVAMYGATAGKVAINKIPLTTNQACCNITLDDKKADFNFVYYSLLNNFDRLHQMTSGAAQQNLNVGLISNFSIKLPPLETQRKIAEILSSLDDKIDLLHKQNQSLESLAQTLFEYHFIHNAKAEWEKGKLGDLIHVSSGKSLKREFFNENGKYEILGANGKIGRTDKYLCEDRLIYTGRVGTLGKIFMIDKPKKVWLSDNTLIISPNDYFYFIYFLLKSLNFENFNVGSTQPLIRQSDLKDIEILIPNNDILCEFELQVKDYFSKIYQNSKQIESLKSLRDIMLPKLLNGEIGVR